MSKPDYRAYVRDFVRDHGFRSVAEIGVWRGALSRLLWRLPLEELVLVDPWRVANIQRVGEDGRLAGTMMGERSPEDPYTQEDLNAIFAEVTRTAPPFVRIIRGESIAASRLVEDASLDFVYLDAMHFYPEVSADLQVWLPKIKPDGYIGGHDLSNRFPGVKQALDELLPGYENYGVVWWRTVAPPQRIEPSI